MLSCPSDIPWLSWLVSLIDFRTICSGPNTLFSQCAPSTASRSTSIAVQAFLFHGLNISSGVVSTTMRTTVWSLYLPLPDSWAVYTATQATLLVRISRYRVVAFRLYWLCLTRRMLPWSSSYIVLVKLDYGSNNHAGTCRVLVGQHSRRCLCCGLRVVLEVAAVDILSF